MLQFPSRVPAASSTTPTRGLGTLQFPAALERRFEEDNRIQRSDRLWRQGLISIAAFVAFYLAESFVTHHASARETLLQLGVIMPLSLAVNFFMRRHPPRVLREGSVAAMASAIGCSYLYLQQGKDPVAIAYTAVGAIVTALFASMVMRLRFFFALIASLVIAAATIAFLVEDQVLRFDQKLTGACLTLIAIAIGMMSNYEMEWEERLSYLRQLENERRGRELSAINARLAELSTTDKLTGLRNRRAYEDRFSKLWAEAAREGSPMSLIVLDVDHFKVLNDVHGHRYGDEVLQRIGSLLEESLRSHKDCVARYGGEEFVVLLPGAEQETAAAVAERIRVLVEMAGSPPQGELRRECLMWVTVSCGYATCMKVHGRRKEELLEAADRALYRAKAEGRNRSRVGALEATDATGDAATKTHGSETEGHA